jgi:hypothetical protein
VKITACRAEDRGSIPLGAAKEDRLLCNSRKTGIPLGTNPRTRVAGGSLSHLAAIAQLVERHVANVKAAGSSPACCSRM